MAYKITWITDQLAIGSAPMSYEELDLLKEQGIGGIVNLCGEYCDLHEIEEKSGFEVYFLPIPDEHAPDMEEMEKALEWLDEAFYLNKKILVHCRHGIGRTGTFVSAYLVRRGLGLKLTEKTLKGTSAQPSSFNQWRLLRKYGKKEGRLTIREPSLENKRTVDLGPFFEEYEALIKDIDEKVEKADNSTSCGADTLSCCNDYFELKFIESIYINHSMNRILTHDDREEAIEKASKNAAALKILKKVMPKDMPAKEFEARYNELEQPCPLVIDNNCGIYDNRPIRCRMAGLTKDDIERQEIEKIITDLSRNVYFALIGEFVGDIELKFYFADIVSGRFVQEYFHYMMEHGR